MTVPFEQDLCDKCGVGNGFHFANCPSLAPEWSAGDEVFFVYPRLNGQYTLAVGTVIAACKTGIFVWSTVIPQGQRERSNWMPTRDCVKSLREAEALVATRNQEQRQP